MPRSKPRFKRILLKLSGEALMGAGRFGIDPTVLKTIAEEIHNVRRQGVEIAIVVGGGNIFRGLNSAAFGLARMPGDYMGMLATVINGIALGEALTAAGSEARVMSAIDMYAVTETYIRERAVHHLSKSRIVVCVAGTGSPYFSTDTAAALRAMELKADVLLKATKVDGVYDSDPVKNKAAKRFDRLTYQEVIEKDLRVMDMTAVALAMEQSLPIIVFNLNKKDHIKKVVCGEDLGTFISGGKQ
ncbi:MAG: UMP kinase [Desulfobacteraceae bacterium]|nr:MAG: UMP kinase [Desulfobacteraceae bacterium]